MEPISSEQNIKHDTNGNINKSPLQVFFLSGSLALASHELELSMYCRSDE